MGGVWGSTSGFWSALPYVKVRCGEGVYAMVKHELSLQLVGKSRELLVQVGHLWNEYRLACLYATSFNISRRCLVYMMIPLSIKSGVCR